VQWGSIVAGAVLASALTLVLVQFGSAIGLADLKALNDPELVLTPARVVTTGVFILIIQVLSSLIGGYTAGRLRASAAGASAHENEVRDGMHGVLSWATATIAVVLTVGIGSMIAGLVAEPSDTKDVVKSAELIGREHTLAILLAFSAAATSLVSAVAAWASAVAGGDHRDRQVDYSRHLTFLVRR
jgi:disulfide bond formation protein DsbB